MQRFAIAALGLAATATSLARASSSSSASSCAAAAAGTAAVAAAAAGADANASSSSSSRTPAKTVRLASSVARPRRPTTVLVHGLDSAKDTWGSVEADLVRADYPTLALDLRGHGESPLGDPDDFSTAALAADVRQAVRDHGVTGRFVLVGHSMGGRVAMRYGADFPEDLAALVIEDMDTRSRDAAAPPPPTPQQLTKLRAFSRRCGASFDECKRTLAAFGYAPGRVDVWRATGRVFPIGGSGGGDGDAGWWSNINPMAQHLALEHVLSGPGGRADFRRLAAHVATSAGDANTEPPAFPVHLFVAGRGSAAAARGPDGVEGMQAMMPQLLVRHFPAADHSIHNTDRAQFLEALKAVVDEAAAASGGERGGPPAK